MQNRPSITVTEAMELTGDYKRGVHRKIAAGKYEAETVESCGGAGGLAYRVYVDSLGAEAQIRYWESRARETMPAIGDNVDLVGYRSRYGELGLNELLGMQTAALTVIGLRDSAAHGLVDAIDQLAQRHGVSSMTLRRWEKAYRENGLAGIMRKSRNDAGQPRSMCHEARRYICEQYLGPERRSQARVYGKLVCRAQEMGKTACAECPYNPASANHAALIGTEDEPFYPACDCAGNGIIIPANRHAVNRMLATVSDEEKTYMRRGRKAWEAAYMAKASRKKPEMVNEAWYGDHHQFDVFAIDENGKLVRPWLTAWYDIGSGMLVGWCISTNPNSETICEAFVRAAASKPNNIVYGIPQCCYIDNGKDYRGKRFEGGGVRDYDVGMLNDSLNASGIMQVLRVEVVHAKPYHGWAKPVERWFRTLEEGYCRDLPGYCGGDPKLRTENFERMLAVQHERGELLTLDELADTFLNEILPAYHNTPHDGYGGETPMARYMRLPKARDEIVGWETLAIIKKEHEIRTVSTQGIGVEATLQLCAVWGGSRDLYIPKNDAVQRELRNRRIKKAYAERGAKVSQLMKQYNLSDRMVQQITKDVRPEQMRLEDYLK